MLFDIGVEDFWQNLLLLQVPMNQSAPAEWAQRRCFASFRKPALACSNGRFPPYCDARKRVAQGVASDKKNHLLFRHVRLFHRLLGNNPAVPARVL
jgi:hypothetical protein